MRRKASEGPYNQRTGSSQNDFQSTVQLFDLFSHNPGPENRRKDLITHKQISKLLSPQKPQIPAVNLYKGDQHKHLHREISPARNIIQRTDPGLLYPNNLNADYLLGFERDIDSANQGSKKPTRVLV